MHQPLYGWGSVGGMGLFIKLWGTTQDYLYTCGDYLYYTISRRVVSIYASIYTVLHVFGMRREFASCWRP